jgi:hypothetical protein
MGEKASSISQAGKEEKPDERLAQYLAAFPNAEGLLIPGRNVLPYESTGRICRGCCGVCQWEFLTADISR